MRNELLGRAVWFLVFLSVFPGLAPYASGDSWAPPKTKEFYSENRRFAARAEPAGGAKGGTPSLSVYDRGVSGTAPLWKVPLGKFPHELFVSDDGRYVVKLNNYAEIGYGDDVAAFYSAAGELRRYSLEQALSLPPGADLTGLFRHSVSSRWWTEDSVRLFREFKGRSLFCVWLAWGNRWLAWGLDDGKPVETAGELRADLDKELRHGCLERVRKNPADAAAYETLGKLRDHSDKALFEAMLKDASFALLQGEDDRGLAQLGARSRSRWLADNILSEWNGVKKEKDPLYSRSYFWAVYEFYSYLGSRVSGTVSFPSAARKGKGRLWLTLEPEAAGTERPAPEFYNQRITADLSGKKLHKDIQFHVFGITPGVYRVKAVWDAAPPLCDLKAGPCEPGAGDSTAVSEPVRVAAGGVTEGVRLPLRKAK